MRMLNVEARPSVAVVITTYNHSHFLGAAIQSVLEQSLKPSEVVVAVSYTHLTLPTILRV